MSDPPTASGRPRTTAEEIRRAGRRLPADLAELQGERLYRAAGLLFLLALVFRHFDPLARVLLITFVGAILAVTFNAVVKRLPLRRGHAVLVVVGATLGALALSIWLAVSALVTQAKQFIADFPVIVTAVEEWLQDRIGLEIELLGPKSREVLSDLIGAGSTQSIVMGAFGMLELLATILLVLVGAFYLVYRPNEQLLIPFMRAIPEHRRPAFRRMFELMGERLSAWLYATLISMVAVGALGVITFYLLGTPYPLLLGVLMGVTDIVPIVGPWIGGAVAVAVTLFADPGKVIWVVVAVVVIQEIESNLVRPIVMSGSAELHPFVTLLALLFFGSIFGILGAVLALPLALAVGTIIQVLWVEQVLHAGDDQIEPVVET
jgi:predicted PurR-regulated permease PerM